MIFYNEILDEAYSARKEFASFEDYNVFLKTTLNSELENTSNSKNNISNYSINLTNDKGVTNILDDWAKKISLKIDNIEDSDEIALKKTIFDSKNEFIEKITESSLNIDDKRIALIYLNSYSNILLETTDNLLKLESSSLLLSSTVKCRWWKKMKWILKCTALSVKAGVECVAAVKKFGWESYKCVLATIAAYDCWANGC